MYSDITVSQVRLISRSCSKVFGVDRKTISKRISLGKIAQMPNFPLCDVLLLNDNDTPMEFVVMVLERFFGMSHDEAVAHMFRNNERKAICGTYSREEAEKKVADVLAFAAKHKHPLQCILEQED
jgi:ATP-dependent Clp protease adaptor protein ClpS